MDPDQALSIAAGIALAVCGLCVGVAAWKNSRGWHEPTTLKASRSDTDLTLILENSIPSSSATRRLTPPDDPSEAASEA